MTHTHGLKLITLSTLITWRPIEAAAQDSRTGEGETVYIRAMPMITGAIILNAGVLAMTSNRADDMAVFAFPLGLFFLIWGVVEHVKRPEAAG